MFSQRLRPIKLQLLPRIGMKIRKLSLIALVILAFSSFQGAHAFDPTIPLDESDRLAPDAPTDLDLHPTDVIHWTGVQAYVQDDGKINVGIRLTTSGGFSIYKEKLKIKPPAGFDIVDVTYPAPISQKDPLNPDELVEVFPGGDFIIILEGFEAFTKPDLTIAITFLGCTKRICLFPYTENLTIPVFPKGSFEADAKENVNQLTDFSDPSSSKPDQTPTEEVKDLQHYARMLEEGKLPIGMLLIVIFLGGLLTNLTPCVFPMVPITLRILGHQKGSSGSNALLYALGIILTYSSIGLVVALSGGLFGALLGNPWITSLFGLIFVILAFTMLGFGNFASLQNLGAKFGQRQASPLNTLMMGAGAGFVAAPCTGPILGALIVYSAKLQNAPLSALLFVLYSSGFALPYVFLGLASSKLRNISVSATIQVGIKILFAAIMFALAFYYLKTPVYKQLTIVQGHWWLLSTVGLFLGTLSAIFFLKHQQIQSNKLASIGPALLLGLGIFSSIQSLTGQDSTSKLSWYTSESLAFTAAKSEQKPILVDGWADWCVACKEMDQTTFRDPEVIDELQKRWIVLKLDLTELNDKSYALAEKYGMPGLPTLVLIAPSGKLESAKRLTAYTSAKQLLRELKAFDRE